MSHKAELAQAVRVTSPGSDEVGRAPEPPRGEVGDEAVRRYRARRNARVERLLTKLAEARSTNDASLQDDRCEPARISAADAASRTPNDLGGELDARADAELRE